jgi:Recombination endonuclease VII
MRKLKERSRAMTTNPDGREQAKRPDANAARRARASHLKSKYNMTLEDEAELIRQQGGACAICGERPAELHVDHSHVTGRVRGLLCLSCNAGIGFYKDDHNLTARATLYPRLAELLFEESLAAESFAAAQPPCPRAKV